MMEGCLRITGEWALVLPQKELILSKTKPMYRECLLRQQELEIYLTDSGLKEARSTMLQLRVDRKMLHRHTINNKQCRARPNVGLIKAMIRANQRQK